MESRFANLHLSHEEEEELVLDPISLPPNQESLDLCIVGRFLTDQPINFNLMRNHLATIWRLKKGVFIKDVGEGGFVFQFFHQMDLQRVLDNCPWTYRKFLLIFHKLSIGDHTLQVPLDSIVFWVQIFDLPLGFLSESIGRQLGNFVGQFIEYDASNLSSIWRSYMRIKVAVDVRNLLKRFKRIKKPDGSSFTVNFKYEKLGQFCFVCGCLSHTESFCDMLFASPTGEVNREWGSWLKAFDRKSTPLGGEKWLRHDGNGIECELSGRSESTGSGSLDKGKAVPTPQRVSWLSSEKVGVSYGALMERKSGTLDQYIGGNQFTNPIFQPNNPGGKENDRNALNEERKRRRADFKNISINNVGGQISNMDETLFSDLAHDSTTQSPFLLAGPGHQACQEQ